MPKKTDKTIEPINANMEDVANKLILPAGGEALKNSNLAGKNSPEPAAPHQFILDFCCQVEKVCRPLELLPC